MKGLESETCLKKSSCCEIIKTINFSGCDLGGHSIRCICEYLYSTQRLKQLNYY